MIDAAVAAVVALVLTITGPATANQQADRGAMVQLTAPPPPPAPPAPTGLWGQPFAPAGLSNCDEMSFYRQQWGLPARFDQLGWRESNCRNEDGVHTSCCWGYWQMWTALHMKDHRLAPRMRNCGITSHLDLNSNDPLEKQRQACAAKQLFDVVGYSAWNL